MGEPLKNDVSENHAHFQQRKEERVMEGGVLQASEEEGFIERKGETT